MADTKTSALTALLGSGVDTANDLLVIDDVSATTLKSIKVTELMSAMGLTITNNVRLISAAALAANTYNNGTAGVGATITMNATGVVTIDGKTVALNDKVLIKDEATGANNGVYTCTTAGAVGVAGVFTRATADDQDAELRSAFFYATEGTQNSGLAYFNTNLTTITFGTTAITFQLFGATPFKTLSGGAFTATGQVAYFEAPTAMTILSWTVIGVGAGTGATFDVWVHASGTVPTVSDTITASAKPNITTGALAQDQAPTGWTVAVPKGAIIAVHCDALSGWTSASVQLNVRVLG